MRTDIVDWDPAKSIICQLQPQPTSQSTSPHHHVVKEFQVLACHGWWCLRPRRSHRPEKFSDEGSKKKKESGKVTGENMGFSADNVKGVVLALLSSGFIGGSFIIKKKGLRRAAAVSGVRAGWFLLTSLSGSFSADGRSADYAFCVAGVGGFSYLLEPLWWLGMVTSKLSAISFLSLAAEKYTIGF